MSLEHWVSQYGYLAIFIGTFFEGETILIIGGFLAHQGYMRLAGVIPAAFLGALAGDQLSYYLGRFRGTSFIERRLHWKAKTEKVYRLLRRRNLWVILGFRFIYGLRIVTPFVIGASGIRRLRFLALNTAGALIWAATIGTLGYSLGRASVLVLDQVKRYELWVLGTVLSMGSIVWLVYWRREGARVKRDEPPPPTP